MYECRGSEHWVVVSNLSISIILKDRDFHVIASDLMMSLEVYWQWRSLYE